MRKQRIGRYIFLGTAFRYLQDAKEGWSFKGKGLIEQNINKFLHALDEFSLTVTRRVASRLEEFRDRLAQRADTHKLTKHEASELRSIVRDIRPTLLAESGGLVAYVVGDKRYRIEHLLDEIYELFGDEYPHFVPEFADADFQEAGRCIAFERPTAAAFHLLRETESVLREYYCARIKRNRVDLLWGPMVASLRAIKKNRPPPELLDHLDSIRKNFRNPTAHPDKVYDISEAQDLMGVCIDVVNRMCRELSLLA